MGRGSLRIDRMCLDRVGNPSQREQLGLPENRSVSMWLLLTAWGVEGPAWGGGPAWCSGSEAPEVPAEENWCWFARLPEGRP